MYENQGKILKSETYLASPLQGCHNEMDFFSRSTASLSGALIFDKPDIPTIKV